MNKIDLETLTFTQLTKVLGIFNKMLENGILQVDLDKSTAILNTNNATTYLENQNIQLQQENQELKKVINQIGLEPDKIVFLQQENAELKKQVEEANEKIILLQASEPMLNYKKSLEKTQQKEFIKYLEDEANKWRNNYDSYNYEYEVEEPTVEELVNNILQRFKEITGMSDEKEN